MSTETHYLEEELYQLVQGDRSIFEFLQSGSLDGIWYWDLENPENEWMSPQFWATLGYDPKKQKHLASEWQDLINPEDLQVAFDNFRKHCADPNHPYDQVVRYRHKNGSTVWVRCRGIAIRDEAGNPIRMLGAHNELTKQKQTEERLRKSEEELRRTLNAVTDGIWTWNFKTNKLFFSPKYYTMLGYRAGEFPADFENWANLIHPNDREKAIAVATEYLKTKPDSYENEFRMRTQSGDYRWIRTRARVAERDENDSAVYMIGNHEDITEHKLAEEALIKSELKWRYILLNTPQIGISLDSDGKIIFVNDHFQKLTGWKAEEIIGQDWFDIFIPGKIREEIRNVFKAVMRQEDTVGYSTYENDIVIKNGELRHISWSNVLTKDLQGKIIDVTCLGIDLTERIRTEEALRNSENKFRNFAEYSLVGIYMIQDGIFTYVNLKFAEIFGYTVEECLNNMHFRQLVYPEDFDTVQEQVRKRASGETQSAHYDFRGIKKTGEIIHVEIFGSSIMLDGRSTVTGTMLDITTSKQAEERLHKSQERLLLATRASNTGIWDWDVVNNKLVWDESMYTLYGIREEDFGGVYEAWTRMVPDEDRQYAEGEIQAALRGEREYDIVHRIIRQDGEVRFIKVGSKTYFDENGKPLRMIGTNIDITKSKQAEEALRESEKKYRNLFNNAEVGIFRSRLDGSEVLEVNRRFLEIVGMTMEETMGKPSVNLWADPKERAEMVKKLVADGSVSAFEYKMLNKQQGDVRDCLTSLRLYREQGILEGSILDITERKRTEEALRSSETFLKTLLNAIPIPVFYKDRNGRYLGFNEAFETFFGKTREELGGGPQKLDKWLSSGLQ